MARRRARSSPRPRAARAARSAPGVTTGELDEAAERFIRSQGGEPAFKGYRGFPGSICASPNSMVVHGIPGAYELARGDMLSIDVGVDARRLGRRRRGARSRSARSAPVAAEAARRDRRVAVRRRRAVPGRQPPGRRLARDPAARRGATGFSVVRSLVGHGVGREHARGPADPQLRRRPARGPLLEEGMVLAIEPMVTAGQPPACGWRPTTGRSTPQDGSLGRPLRVHGRDHRRRAAHADPVAPRRRRGKAVERADVRSGRSRPLG